MDSRQHAEQLTARVRDIISGVSVWSTVYGWQPYREDVARLDPLRKAIAELVAKLLVLDHVLAQEGEAAMKVIEEREARQEPGADVLAGVEG